MEIKGTADFSYIRSFRHALEKCRVKVQLEGDLPYVKHTRVTFLLL